MGAAVGQDCALLEEVCGWINAKATVPVWAKMTPNITDITQVCLLSFLIVSLLMQHLLSNSDFSIIEKHVIMYQASEVLIWKPIFLACLTSRLSLLCLKFL